MADTDPFDVLTRCPLFAGVGRDDLRALAEGASTWRYEEGAALFLAGDPPAGLHVMAEGRVKVYVISPESGRELVLTMEQPFQTVAELPSFDGGPYPAHAQAVEETLTVFLPQEHLEAVLAARPALARHMLRTLGRRLRALVGLVEQISFQEVVHRLARYLLDHAAGGPPVELETNAAIAAQIGTVPELVSRNLGRLAHGGAVGLEGRTVVRVDREQLEMLAETAGR